MAHRTTVLLTFALGAFGCNPEIGDACQRSVDCSIRGERICDLSNRVGGKGECTIEGCGRDSCPKKSVCIKNYGSDFLTVACDPLREDRATLGPNGESLPPSHACDAHEICLPEGLCASEFQARTSCRRRCKDDGDCRAGYSCSRTGSRGVYRAPKHDAPDLAGGVRICVPSR